MSVILFCYLCKYFALFKSDFNKFHFPAFQFLNNITNIERIFPHHLLCQSISNEDKCFGNKENFVFYYDRNHLTNKKAKQIIYNKQNSLTKKLKTKKNFSITPKELNFINSILSIPTEKIILHDKIKINGNEG